MLRWLARVAALLTGMSIAASALERGRVRRTAARAGAGRAPVAPTLADARSTDPRHLDALGEVGPQPELARGSSWRQRPREVGAIVVRAVKGALKTNVTDRAAALAYYGFLAVPSLLIVGLGVTGLVVDPSEVQSLVNRLSSFAPQSAIDLVQEVLDQVTSSGGSGISLIALGTLFALISATGAATALMRGLNSAYGRSESRGTISQRLTALIVIGLLLLAVVLALGAVALGPVIADRVGDAVGQPGLIEGLWAGLQWPLAIVGLVAAFGGILYFGPDVEQPGWKAVIPGAVFSTVGWLLLSGLFSIYVANFGSYDAAWGSLSAVVVLLTWIWLSSLALLLGARVNAETERSRELKDGVRAERGLALAPRGAG